jgi:hypothetical protein
MCKMYKTPKGKVVWFLNLVFFLFVLLVTSDSYAQNDGDLRSILNSGNWNDPLTWERYDAPNDIWEASGVGANNPGQIPSGSVVGGVNVGTSVFIQSQFTVILTANASCLDLNIANSANGTPSSLLMGKISLNTNTLSVFGILRTYANNIGTVDPLGNISGTPDDDADFSRYPFTAATGGKVSIEGGSRTLFNTGQWGGNVTSPIPANGVFPLEINLDFGETVSVNVGFKVSSFVVNTGTFEANIYRIAVDNGTTGQGDVTINVGGTVTSALTGTGASGFVMSRTGTTRAGNFNHYGSLILFGASPYIEFNSITFHPGSIIEYSKGSNQNILRKSIGTSIAIPTTYPNLIKSGGGILSVLNSISIKESLTISAGTLTLGTNDITMISDPNRTANLEPVTGTINQTSTGRFIIERYLPAAKSWRYLATPIEIATSPTITDSWREGGTSLSSTGYGTRITGPDFLGPAGASTLDQYTLRPSMKSYNGSGYVGITQADLLAGKKIANEEGYAVFVNGGRGEDAQNPTSVSSTTLRIRGKIRAGNQTFNLTAPAGGFLSVGNPYASRIDFRTVIKNNISASFYLWNPNGGFYGVGLYEVYVRDIGTGEYKKNGTGTVVNTIESGQAFFVQSISPGFITIQESDKKPLSSNVSRPGVSMPTLDINLHTNDASGNDYVADGLMLNFDASLSSALDNMDVKKISNSVDNLAIKYGTKNLVVERRPNLTQTDTIRLSLTSTRIAAYRFEIDPSLLTNTGLTAFLKDKFLQTETTVSLTAVTNVNFDITADAGSKVADRFMIVFRQAVGGPLPVTFIDIAAAKNNDKTNVVKWNVANELNIQQYEIERSEKGTNFLSIGNNIPLNNTGGNYGYNFVDVKPLVEDNYYRVKATFVNGEIQYSAIVKVLADTKASSIAVYPNPVEGKKIRVSFNNKAGKYNLALLSSEGKTIYTQNIIITSVHEVKTIDLNKHVSQGQYELVVTSSEGVKHVLPIVIQ